jgi:thioredoxin-related protein
MRQLFEHIKRLLANTYVSWGLQILAVIGVFWVVSWYQTKDVLRDNARWKSLELSQLDGDKTPVIKEGVKNIIYVWAPWCGVCSLQTETIQATKDWLPEGTEFRSIVLSYDSIEQVRKKAKDKDIRMPIFLGTNAFNHSFNISAFPTILITDRTGRTEHVVSGYTTPLGLWWRSFW